MCPRSWFQQRLSCRETLVELVQTVAQEGESLARGESLGEPSFAKFRLEELTFFLDNLLEKQTIDYYGDYHQQFQSIFEQVDMSDWWTCGTCYMCDWWIFVTCVRWKCDRCTWVTCDR